MSGNQGTEPSPAEKLLIDAKLSLIDMQNTLSSDQQLQFIKLLKGVPTGVNPRSITDVDNTTKYLYKNIPATWPGTLIKSTKEEINKIRTTFKLPLLNDLNYVFIILITLALVGLLFYFLRR